MLDKLKQRMVDAKNDALQHADAVSKSIRVSAETQATRMEICRDCEHLYEPTNTCKRCGCFMNVKTWLAPARCPVDKWHPVKISEHGSDD